MKYRYGKTVAEVKIDENDKIFFRVTHTGKMGTRLNNVIDDVRKIFNYSEEDVKFIIINVDGTPDYYYKADFYFYTKGEKQ